MANPIAIVAYDESAARNDMRISAVVVSAMPAATTYFVPNRWTKRGDRGARIIIGTATARRRTPVWSGE